VWSWLIFDVRQSMDENNYGMRSAKLAGMALLSLIAFAIVSPRNALDFIVWSMIASPICLSVAALGITWGVKCFLRGEPTKKSAIAGIFGLSASAVVAFVGVELLIFSVGGISLH
jgi:hypothetical protein